MSGWRYCNGNLPRSQNLCSLLCVIQSIQTRRNVSKRSKKIEGGFVEYGFVDFGLGI